MRADREGAEGANLYKSLWAPFETSFWSEEQRRGRLRKPRLEWFVQSALQAETAENVDVGKLYTDYRKFALGKKIPVTAEVQLRTLTKHADQYRQFTSGAGQDAIARFGKPMSGWALLRPTAARCA